MSLGLDARFDRLESWALLANTRPLAVDGAGQVYAVSSDSTTGSIHVFGRDGRYARTLLPSTAEAKPLPAQFAPITWNQTVRGDYVPRRNRFGGGFDFDLSKYPNFFTDLTAATVTGDGKLCLLRSDARAGNATLFLVDARDGSCPAEGVIDLGVLAADAMAASPDGKWLYFAGRQKHAWDKGNAFSHAVMRTPLAKPAKPEVFLGEVTTQGNDDAHFNCPNRVACDGDGNLYVGDSGNSRIQVYRPDGTHLKTIPDRSGLFGVSHKTGAIYLWNQSSWQKDPIITKLKGLNDPAMVAEITVSCGGEWREGKQSAMLSSESDPPRVWFSGASYRGKPVAVGIEDRGESLKVAADLQNGSDVADIGGDLTSPGQWKSLHVDRRDGTVVWDTPIGPHGRRYARTQYFAAPKDMPQNKMWVVRFDPEKQEYVPFAEGDQAGMPGPMDGYRPWFDKGKPVIGIPMFYAKGSHLHNGPFCVAPNGDIYVGVTYSEQTDAELEKAGSVRLQPKRLNPVSAPVLRVYGPDGKLKSPSALPGLAELEGLRVGRSGAVYVVQPWKPIGQKLPDGLAEGSTYEPSRWGSLIKFGGNFKRFPVGRVEGAWEAPPAKPTHESPEFKVKLEGALWTYGGVSPHSGVYSACTCMKAGADLDDYERSFVCAAQTCTVNVIDSHGNVMGRLGGYGNLDQTLVSDPTTGELRPRRPDDPKELRSPARPLAFGLPRNVAASDDAMWVADLNHRALVKATLVYRAEASAPIP